MFNANLHQNEQMLRLDRSGSQSDHTRFALEAVSLYRNVELRALLNKLAGKLLHDDRHLANLAAIVSTTQVRSRHYAGLQMVAVSQIRGSEGRLDDFDASFNPIKGHNRSRWLSVADAMLRGQSLPPVELIQVGDRYYVRDGHHRISVAQALGQLEIEAEVTVWELAPDSNCQPVAGCLQAQPA